MKMFVSIFCLRENLIKEKEIRKPAGFLLKNGVYSPEQNIYPLEIYSSKEISLQSTWRPLVLVTFAFYSFIPPPLINWEFSFTITFSPIKLYRNKINDIFTIFKTPTVEFFFLWKTSFCRWLKKALCANPESTCSILPR